eukprot:scaffold5173_cov39-Phaeocystis_antarctica.AAC.1
MQASRPVRTRVGCRPVGTRVGWLSSRGRVACEACGACGTSLLTGSLTSSRVCVVHELPARSVVMTD